MKSEGLFLCEIAKGRTGNVTKTIKEIEIPDSLTELFNKKDEIVSKLGDRIQQIYYTVGKVRLGQGHTREGISQNYFLIDVDYIIQDRKLDYIPVVCAHFGIDKDRVGVIDSGYGLQFLIGFETPATKKDFDDCGELFKTQIRLLELALQDSGLIGTHDTYKGTVKTHIDTSVFRLASLARMPGTINHDPTKNREPRRAKLIQGKVEPQAISLKALLQKGVKVTTTEEDEIPSPKDLKVDGDFVKQNCGLLKWAFANPEKIHEKDFFFVAGLLKHCDTDLGAGEKSTLEWFKTVRAKTESPTLSAYSDKKALDKIIRAFPATYKKLEAHYGAEMFQNDPNREHNVHPLQMQSSEFSQKVARESGFHKKIYRGKQELLVPDYDNLRLFFEQKYSYVTCNEICWVFNGKYYVRFEKDFLKGFAQDHFKPSVLSNVIQEFVNLILRTNLIRPNDWEQNTHLKFNFSNGVLDLESKVFTPHDDQGATRKFLFRSCLPYDYDPNATAPNFDKFMSDVTRNVDEFKQNALEYFGYAISGEPIWLAQTLLLLGPDGAGGKSTTLNIIKKVVGSGFYSTLSFEDLNDPQARAMLEGKYFNVFGETESSKYLQSKVWKALTTGEEVTIKNVFEKPYAIKSRAKMMFASNHVPKSNDTSDAFFRRWLIIPFTRNFIAEGVADPFIEKKLESELPGIFNMLISSYKRLKARGHFELGAKSQEVFEEFKDEIDPFRDWFKDNVEDLGATVAPTDTFTSTQELFRDFKDYCIEENQMVAVKLMTSRAFSQKLLKYIKDPSAKRLCRHYVKIGSGLTVRVRGFSGIRLAGRG